jgi:hypothetical protein
VLVEPATTGVGDADNETEGGCGGSTLTTTVAVAEPPRPVQVNEKVVDAISRAVDSEPDVARLPLQPPDALHELASVLLH